MYPGNNNPHPGPYGQPIPNGMHPQQGMRPMQMPGAPIPQGGVVGPGPMGAPMGVPNTQYPNNFAQPGVGMPQQPGFPPQQQFGAVSVASVGIMQPQGHMMQPGTHMNTMNSVPGFPQNAVRPAPGPGVPGMPPQAVPLANMQPNGPNAMRPAGTPQFPGVPPNVPPMSNVPPTQPGMQNAQPVGVPQNAFINPGQPPVSGGMPVAGANVPQQLGTPGGNAGAGTPNPFMNPGTTTSSPFGMGGVNKAPASSMQMGGLSQPSPFNAPMGLSAPGIVHGTVPVGQAANVPLAEVKESLQCPAAYMSLSMNVFPKDKSVLSKAAIPFGACVHPLSEEEGSLKDDIPIVNFGADGIVRCKKCRAYVNPFITFCDGGRRWRCNFCHYTNDVTPSYFSQTNEMGIRQDHDQRIELNCGAVEFIAPVEYTVRAPQPPAYLFLLDVSFTAQQCGMLRLAVESIKRSLDKLPGGTRTKIGFITFDNSIHFIEIRPNKSPRMMVVGDIEEIFLPVMEDLMPNLSECHSSIISFLNNLPSMFQHSRVIDSALGPALRAAYSVLENIGGKIVVCTASLPSIGPGKLTVRETQKLLGSEEEHTLLAPNSSEDGRLYKSLAVDMSKQQISVDMFLHSQHYIDVATLGGLARYTSGEVHYYNTLSSPADAMRFGRELEHSLGRATGLESVLRIRCSQGVNIVNFYGNFFIRGTDLLAIPVASSDTAFNVEFLHEDGDTLQPGSTVALQAALLYTHPSGDRRIRVLTLCRPVSSNPLDLFKHAQLEPLTNLMAKMALDQALRTGLPAARRYLHKTVVDIVRAYKNAQSVPFSGHGIGMGMSRQPTAPQTGANATPTPQDIASMLPESLQLLPLFTMALQKCTLFRGGIIRSDERAYLMYRMLTMPVASSVTYVYPRLFELHKMDSSVGRSDSSFQPTIAQANLGILERVVLPATVSLSAASLVTNGCFLLDAHTELLLWVGKAAPQGLISALFGVPQVDQLSQEQCLAAFTPLENDYSKRVHAIIKSITDFNAIQPKFRIVKEGSADVNEQRFHWYLVEDRQDFQGGQHSYAEYASIVYKESQRATYGGVQ